MTDGPTRSNDLDALFGRLACGDRTAIGPAFQALYPLVRRFCQHLLGKVPDADDATQQAVERVFEQIGTYDPTRHAIPWALAIAAWEVKTIRRRSWRTRNRQSTTDDADVVGTVPDPETSAISRQMLSAVSEIVEDLAETDREVLVQVIQRELAEVLDDSNDATFRKRKERAMVKLRSMLRNLGHVQ